MVIWRGRGSEQIGRGRWRNVAFNIHLVPMIEGLDNDLRLLGEM